MSHSILVVDDSSDILSLMPIVFESEGFEVFTAKNGALGLDLLLSGLRPSLVLLDRQLSDMNGSMFLEILKANSSKILTSIPVVYFTGSRNTDVGLAAGIIFKPVDLDNLTKAVMGYILPMAA